MISHQFIHVLVTITLVEMMVAIGLSVPPENVVRAARIGAGWRRALAVNYLVVPAAALALIELFVGSQSVAAGLFILAVFPGGAYGPPFTAIARGDLSLSVGLMVLLAALSPLVGPVLLRLLLHLTSVNTSLSVDVPGVIMVLAFTQLLPLSAGMFTRKLAPALAARLRNPAQLLSKVLNGCTIVFVLATQWQHSAPIHLALLLAMLGLLTVSLVAGYLLGGPGRESRKAVALTASLRNVGVSVMIASGPYAGSAALAAVVGYAIVEITGSALLSFWWGRHFSVRSTLRRAV